MSLTREELCQSSCDRSRTSHAALARSHHTGLSPVRTTRCTACLAPCAGLAPRHDARPWGTDGDGCLAGHGAELRTAFHQRPSRLEPGQLVAPPGRSHADGMADDIADAPGDDRLGADDTVERRCGRRITTKGCDREAVRSSKTHVIRCFSLKWVLMMRLVPVPWSQRVWALPLLTAWCWPAQKGDRRRHKTSINWVRPMMKQVQHWLPGQRLVWVVDGDFAAVSRALACVTHHGVRVSRRRWEAAWYHPPEPPPPGKRGRHPTADPCAAALSGWQPAGDAGHRAGIALHKPPDAFLRHLQAGEVPLRVDNPTQGREHSRTASLTSRLDALDPIVRQRLGVLMLLRGVVDADVLEGRCAVDDTPERLHGLGREDWERMLDTAPTIGLLRRVEAGNDTVHPAWPSASRICCARRSRIAATRWSEPSPRSMPRWDDSCS